LDVNAGDSHEYRICSDGSSRRIAFVCNGARTHRSRI
jgi:hypothetical protein